MAKAVSTTKILRTLFDLGYFGSKKWTDARSIKGPRLAKAVAEYQKFHGLDASGKVDDRTLHRMHRGLRCGLPDMEMRMNEGVCAWPMKQVKYYTNLQLPGLSKADAIRAFDAACKQWSAICGIQLVRVNAASSANIVSVGGSGRADGLDSRGGTLAWSELPCGARPNTQLQQKYDQAEDWNYMMAVAVMCHELGHALGLPHLPKGNLMAPYYDPRVTLPQKGDIREMIARYGKPAAPAAPAVVPNVSGVVLINGNPFVFQTPVPDPRPTSVIDVQGELTIASVPFTLVPR